MEYVFAIAVVILIGHIAYTLSKGFKNMANLSEAQVLRLETAINNCGTDLKKLVADFKALPTGSDPQPLLDRVDTAGQALEDLDLSLKSNDPTPIVPPAPTT